MEEELKNYIIIAKSEYLKLIEAQTKYIQYKNYMLKNTQNNKIIQTVTTIEGKNLYDLLKEMEENE